MRTTVLTITVVCFVCVRVPPVHRVTSYFVNTTTKTDERQVVLPSGQRVIILGKAVNADHLNYR